MVTINMRKTKIKYYFTILLLIFQFSCSSRNNTGNIDKISSPPDYTSQEHPFTSPEMIDLYESNLSNTYFIGPGDLIKIEIWNRPELTGEHTVGPYGNITLPILGEFKIGGITRKDAIDAIRSLYTNLYDDPVVTVKILKYMNNKVYVLGRVSNPGVIHLDGNASLLEALSMAGGLPTDAKTTFLSKCYVIRGKDQIIWVDLIQLLEKANLKLNIRLANNDIIYIPDSMDASVFVMGEVRNPGSYPIQTSGLSILDAINFAGGPNENANVRKIRLVRSIKRGDTSKVINLESIIANGDFSDNFILKDNDIVYVPRKGIATFNYYLRQVDPFLRTFISGALLEDELD